MKYYVDYNFVNGIAMTMQFFNTKEEADAFANSTDGVVGWFI